MKTSLINLFKAITDAKASLIAERDKPENASVRDQLIDSIAALDQLANDIMILDIIDQADQIKEEAAQLREITNAINETSDRLEHITKVIDDIADKVDAVIKAASVLSTVGLLG